MLGDALTAERGSQPGQCDRLPRRMIQAARVENANPRTALFLNIRWVATRARLLRARGSQTPRGFSRTGEHREIGFLPVGRKAMEQHHHPEVPRSSGAKTPKRSTTVLPPALTRPLGW